MYDTSYRERGANVDFVEIALHQTPMLSLAVLLCMYNLSLVKGAGGHFRGSKLEQPAAHHPRISISGRRVLISKVSEHNRKVVIVWHKEPLFV